MSLLKSWNGVYCKSTSSNTIQIPYKRVKIENKWLFILKSPICKRWNRYLGASGITTKSSIG